MPPVCRPLLGHPGRRSGGITADIVVGMRVIFVVDMVGLQDTVVDACSPNGMLVDGLGDLAVDLHPVVDLLGGHGRPQALGRRHASGHGRRDTLGRRPASGLGLRHTRLVDYLVGGVAVDTRLDADMVGDMGGYTELAINLFEGPVTGAFLWSTCSGAQPCIRTRPWTCSGTCVATGRERGRRHSPGCRHGRGHGWLH